MNATISQSTIHPIAEPVPEAVRAPWKKNAIVAAKVLLVALVIGSLVAATIFSGGIALSLLGAGGAAWKTILASGCALTGAFSVIGAVTFSFTEHMYKHTATNCQDAKNFLLKTSGVISAIGFNAVNLAREFKIWS